MFMGILWHLDFSIRPYLLQNIVEFGFKFGESYAPAFRYIPDFAIFETKANHVSMIPNVASQFFDPIQCVKFHCPSPVKWGRWVFPPMSLLNNLSYFQPSYRFDCGL